MEGCFREAAEPDRAESRAGATGPDYQAIEPSLTEPTDARIGEVMQA